MTPPEVDVLVTTHLRTVATRLVRAVEPDLIVSKTSLRPRSTFAVWYATQRQARRATLLRPSWSRRERDTEGRN